MAQNRKGTAIRIPKKIAPDTRQSKRSGGKVAHIACACAVKLDEVDPIIEGPSGGIDTPSYKPNYSTAPGCSPTPNCEKSIDYTWSISDAVPPAAQGGPVIVGPANQETVKVTNRGTFKLQVEVRVKCSRPGQESSRITRCPDSGEAEFEIN